MPPRLPFGSSPLRTVCDIEAAESYKERRNDLPSYERSIIDKIENSFEEKPGYNADVVWTDPGQGTFLIRERAGLYVMYQHFSGTRTRVLIKIWWCGTYEDIGGRRRYDFEVEDVEP